MTPAPALTGQRLAQLAAILTDQERDLLSTLAKLRLACTRQLEALHFTAASPLSNARHARRVLAKLARLGVVARLDRRVGGVRAGSAGYVWSLDVAGQAFVTRQGPAGGRRLRRPWTPGRAFLTHRLAISALYVDLVQADRSGQLDLLRFDPEPDAWRRFTGPHGAPAVLKPDAFLQVGLGEFLDGYFVEIDLATESPAVIAGKLTAYAAYWRTGQEQAHSDGVFPVVAFLVPTAKRADVIRAAFRQSPHQPSVFRVGLLSEAVEFLTSGAAA